MFTAADKTKVISFLSSATTAGDALGKLKRDLVLLLRSYPGWDPMIRDALNVYISYINTMLLDLDHLERDTLALVNELLPPE